jgi:hypothetical protein
MNHLLLGVGCYLNRRGRGVVVTNSQVQVDKTVREAGVDDLIENVGQREVVDDVAAESDGLGGHPR